MVKHLQSSRAQLRTDGCWTHNLKPLQPTVETQFPLIESHTLTHKKTLDLIAPTSTANDQLYNSFSALLKGQRAPDAKLEFIYSMFTLTHKHVLVITWS